MKNREVRDWLGIYFLVVTTLMAGYLLILADSFLLPMSKSQANGSLQIIIPLFVGQLTVMFKTFLGPPLANPNARIDIPVWAVKLPPLCVLFLVLMGLVAIIVSNMENASLNFGPEEFKALITICVSILNATTIFVVAKYFPSVQ